MKNRKIPFGYEMQKGKIKISETEAEILHRIFAEYINGRNLKELAEMLAEQNIEYLPGMSAWNKNRIKRILEDKRYTGDDKYPMIIENQIFTQANEIKTKRRNTSDNIVTADSKPLVYSVRCGCCGAMLKHRTIRKLRNSEKWYCESVECKIMVKKTISEIIKYVVEIINGLITNPELVEQDEDEQEMSSEISLMESEIERMMNQEYVDKTEIQNRILECAAKKYEQIKSKAHITQRLKAEFERSDLLSDFYIDLFEKTVSAIRMNIDGQISIVLKNGKLIRKGETNGECSSTA